VECALACMRGAGMYKATRHRWPALELHAHMKEREDEQGFEEVRLKGHVFVWEAHAMALCPP